MIQKLYYQKCNLFTTWNFCHGFHRKKWNPKKICDKCMRTRGEEETLLLNTYLKMSFFFPYKKNLSKLQNTKCENFLHSNYKHTSHTVKTKYTVVSEVYTKPVRPIQNYCMCVCVCAWLYVFGRERYDEVGLLNSRKMCFFPFQGNVCRVLWIVGGQSMLIFSMKCWIIELKQRFRRLLWIFESWTWKKCHIYFIVSWFRLNGLLTDFFPI